MPRAQTPAEAPVGSLVEVPLNGKVIPATIIEDRGPLGVGGRRIVRLRFMYELAEDPVETEVPLETLKLLALPDDPAERRTWAEAVGTRWVGTYIDLRGRVAVVTKEMPTEQQAKRAAVRWVRAAEKEERSLGSAHAYSWQPHPRYPGRYAVYRESRLGPRLVLEPA